MRVCNPTYIRTLLLCGDTLTTLSFFLSTEFPSFRLHYYIFPLPIAFVVCLLVLIVFNS